MLTSAEEFIRLRTSKLPADYYRAAHEPADISTWLEIIERYPEYKV